MRAPKKCCQNTVECINLSTLLGSWRGCENVWRLRGCCLGNAAPYSLYFAVCLRVMGLWLCLLR